MGCLHVCTIPVRREKHGIRITTHVDGRSVRSQFLDANLGGGGCQSPRELAVSTDLEARVRTHVVMRSFFVGVSREEGICFVCMRARVGPNCMCAYSVPFYSLSCSVEF